MQILETEDLGNSTAAHEHYPKYYGAAYRKVFEQAISRAGSPREPALAVLSGLTARYPKTRYTVSVEMTIRLALLACLPVHHVRTGGSSCV